MSKTRKDGTHKGKCVTRVGVVAGEVIIECRRGCGAGFTVVNRSYQPSQYPISPAA